MLPHRSVWCNGLAPAAISDPRIEFSSSNLVPVSSVLSGMGRSVVLTVLALFAVSCGAAEGPDEPGSAPPATEEDFFQSPEPKPPRESREPQRPVTDSATGRARQEPEVPPPPEAGDEVPSIEEQIRQCIEQTGLPEACRDKIEHGIIE